MSGLTPTPTRPAAEAEGTRYLVLKSEDDGWHTVNHATARTGEKAITTVVEKLAEKDQPGTYVAVPARNWHPFTVKTETQTKLVLGEAKP